MTVRTIYASLSVLCVCGVLANVAANSDQSSEAATSVGSPDQPASGARRTISGPPVVEVLIRDSTGPDNPPGTKSCQVLLHLNAPGDELLAVVNADISTDDPDGFFQSPPPFGGSTSPSCDFIPFLPDLAQDSYVTFQVECDDGSDSTDLVPFSGFDEVLFNTEGRLVGGWFNGFPPSGQGLPDAEGNVLIAQFTMGEFHNTCGTLTAFVQGDFGLPAPVCPDLDGNDEVRVPDLFLLFQCWGPCPGPCGCSADFNDDDVVDVLDLVILLNGWGPCGEDQLPVVGFPVSFECPGFTCFQEIPTISKWSQLPHGAQEGFNVASDVDWQTLDKQPFGSPGPGPDWVVADDFISDGRPITALRWWGSYIDPAFEPSMSMSVQGPSSTDHADLLPSGTRTAMLGSNCCEAHGGNGCDDPECQGLVCAGNPLCCFDPPIGGWNQTCADSAQGLCTICGASDCCITHPTPGCDDPSCESAVCAIDPACCDTGWNVACLITALSIPCEACIPGSTCGDPAAGDCCIANGTPGCDDEACCNAVCTEDSSCCSNPWTQACADLAQASPFCTCDIGPVCPGEGDCFNPNPTRGCQDASCCETVCAAQPSCCEGPWGDLCAQAAFDLCAGTDVDGWLISFHADDPALDHPDTLLGLYSCPAAAVQIMPTDIDGWDAHSVYEYVANLQDCCLLHAFADRRHVCAACDCDVDGSGACDDDDLDALQACIGMPGCPDVNCDGVSDDLDLDAFDCLRTGGEPGDCCQFNEVSPAQDNAFREVGRFLYWLDIQAVVGHTVEEIEGSCISVETANRADDHIWGWHTSDLECFDNSAMGELVMGPLGEWVYQNWTPVDGFEHMLDRVDQAFELLTLVDTCPWDLAGGPEDGPDGQVRVPDLIVLLANWGPYNLCELERLKPMDFNGNLTVRVPDLVELLAHWGRCPCDVDGDCPSSDCQAGLCVPLD